MIPINAVPPLHLNDTGTVRALSLGSEVPREVECTPVLHGDLPTNRILDELVAALKLHQSRLDAD